MGPVEPEVVEKRWQQRGPKLALLIAERILHREQLGGRDVPAESLEVVIPDEGEVDRLGEPKADKRGAELAFPLLMGRESATGTGRKSRIELVVSMDTGNLFDQVGRPCDVRSEARDMDDHWIDSHNRHPEPGEHFRHLLDGEPLSEDSGHLTDWELDHGLTDLDGDFVDISLEDRPSGHGCDESRSPCIRLIGESRIHPAFETGSGLRPQVVPAPHMHDRGRVP